MLYHSKIIFTTVCIREFNGNILVCFHHIEKNLGLLQTITGNVAKYNKLKNKLKIKKKSANFLVFLFKCILLSNKNRKFEFYMIRTICAP